jgi:GH24 family phage-related lysozyme (muramidase)
MKIIDILQKIIKEGSDPNNADSYPSHNEWKMKDWKTYYNALVKKWGKENDAKKQFLYYWEPIYQSWLDEPAEDELDDESTGFKTWFKQREMWNGPENRPYLQKEFEDVLKYNEKYGNSSTSTGPATGVSDKLVEYVKQEEFFVKCVYDDANGTPCIRKDFNACCLKGRKPKGIATIGYGTVYYPDGTKVTPSDKDISIEVATRYLKVTLDTIAKKLLKVYPNLNQQQLDAMASLCYNVGFAGCTSKAPNLSAAIKKDPNSKTNPKIKPNFLDFANADRRADEFGIYHDGNYPTA